MRTSYRLEGPADAPVVTLAHPLGATLEKWDPQVAALLHRYRVLRYDIRGHGGSEVPPGPYTLEQMADDLLALLDRLEIRETHFVRLSMGGLIGMTAALGYPDRIRRLVLCDTTAQYGPAVEGMWHERLRVAETEGMTETLIERTMAIWFTDKFRAGHAAEVDRVRAMLRATDPRGYAASIRAIGFVNLTPRLGAIRSPTLVIVGEKDPGTPPAMAEVLHEKIPGARLVILPGAMHCSAVEESKPIRIERAGMRRSVSIPRMLDIAVEGIPGASPTEPIYLDNVGHPAASRLALAKASRGHMHAFGINWDDTSGKVNGHFAPFAWSSS